MGFTIFNARRYKGSSDWHLAKAHHNYAEQIPATIRAYIDADHKKHLTEAQLDDPIGGTAIMHSYATRPNMAQKYRTPMWKVPSCGKLQGRDRNTVLGNNRQLYEDSQTAFHIFAKDLLTRLNQLEVDNG